MQTLYQKALIFAATKHTEAGQFVPGTRLPYIVHISNVAMEILVAARHTVNFNLELAVQVALLHDTLEDTNTAYDELLSLFGIEVFKGVQALTKDKNLLKEQQMDDCLNRIKLLAPEIRAVKLADRITNLQPPPSDWDMPKRTRYLDEAKVILHRLKGGNDYLEKRLQDKIEDYKKFTLL